MTATPIPPARAAALRAMTPRELADEIADCRLWLAIHDEPTDTHARAVAVTLNFARREAFRRAAEV